LYAAFKHNFPGVNNASHGAVELEPASIPHGVSSVSSTSIASIALTNTAMDAS
jgi:hypothetical protein